MKKTISVLTVIFIAVFYNCSYAEKDEHSFTITEAGKHGPITFVVTISRDGTITDMAILESEEVRGAKIGRKRFLKQFVGKSSKDTIKLREDIDAVSGATVSSKAAVRAARRALVLWEKQRGQLDF